MSLYAIGDLHLSLSADKPMDVFGGGWAGYMDKLAEGFKALGEDDLCVLCGDLSWGMSLAESLKDFQYIENLPGRKIVLKGNHDYWWNTVSKMRAFFEANGITSIDILHNNCYFYEGIAICGTRGWLSDDSLTAEKNAQVAAREAARLRTSLQAAVAAGEAAGEAADAAEKICFFHFPPRFGNVVCQEAVSVMSEFGVKRCFYGHLHGHGHRHAVRGDVEGIEYEIIAADYIDFAPKRIL